MSNVLEYILRLRDEFSATARNAASSSQSSLSAIGGGALLVASNFDTIARRSGQAFGVLTGHYDQLGSLLGALPGPIGVVGSVIGQFIGGAITKVLALAESFDKLSQKTGISVEFLSGFTEAADDVRVSSDAVETSLLKFARGLGGLDEPMDGAIAGGKGVTGALRDLNIAAFDTTGKMRPMEEVLLDVSDAFQAMPNGPEKAALAVALFGKSGDALLPILNKGSKAIGEMMQAAKDAGLVITQETVVAMDRLKRSQDTLSDSWDGIWRQIGGAVIPVLADLTTGINQYGIEANKAKSETDLLTRFTTGADLAFRFFTGALKDTESATKDEKQATEDATAAKANAETATRRLKDEEAKLKEQVNFVTGAFGGQTEMLTDMQLAQMAIDLATGKVTVAQLEQTTAAKALTKAYKDGDVDFQTVVTTMTGLAKGTISVEDALKKAGKAGDKYAAELGGVKWQAQLANSETAGFKRTLDTIPASKSTQVSATVTGGQLVVDMATSVTNMPTSKNTAVTATTTGKQGVDDLATTINNVPSQKTTRVDATTTGYSAVGSMATTIANLPSQKTTRVDAVTTGVSGSQNTVQGAIDTINQLKDLGLNVGVNTTVTVLGYNANSPVKRAALPSAGPSLGQAGGGLNLNMPMTVNVKQGADAYALQAALRNVARAASLRASLG